MMNPYVLAVPERVISGAGCISKLPELLKELEKKKSRSLRIWAL